MLSKKLHDFWRGYVVVTLLGEHVPQVLNQATARGIALWEVQQVPKGGYRLQMHRDDVGDLLPILKQNKTKIRFERKLGLPFLTWRAWRRKFFLAGALTFLISLYALTSVVWEVEVEGAEKRISPETIKQAAAEIGLKPGAWIGNLPDADILQEELQNRVPELTWAGIQIQGTKVKIQVVEKIEGVKPQPTNPQDIKAAKTATVREIFVHKGKALVKRGETVQAGQPLITGALGDGQSHVHATGVVRAAVWYESKIQIPLQTERKKYTGASVEKHFLTFWGYPVQIWGYGKLQFTNMEELPEDKTLRIGDFVFPIQYRHTVYREVEKEQVAITEADALTRGLELIAADVATKMGKDGKIETQKVLQKQLKDGKLDIKVLNVVVEDIGIPQAYTAPPPSETTNEQAKKPTQ